VLDQFQGTILLVSHDRYLIDALGTQIWEIKPGQAMLQTFEGTYTQYSEWQERMAAEQVARAAGGVDAPARRTRPNGPSPEEKKRQKQLREVEERISGLETELAELSRKLENPPADVGKVHQLGKEYARVQAELDQLMEEWAELQEAVG